MVFGGSGIIGGAIAKEFGQQGWAVGVHYHRNRSSAEKTVAAIKKSDGNARHYQADVKDPSQIEKLFQSFHFFYSFVIVFSMSLSYAIQMPK